MRKTYIATVPNHIGAFLAASRLFAELGVNITRVSYNKAVDLHTIFIEAEGTAAQLEQAGKKLAAIGYLRADEAEKRVALLEFRLPDVPGSVTNVLALIERFRFNLSYLSSQADGSGYQAFRMGLFVEDDAKLGDFLREAGRLCPVRVVEYDRTETSFDNSIFYDSFVSGLCRTMQLPAAARQPLLIDANLAMQTLSGRGLPPFRTFDAISRFADLLAKSRGTGFLPRITQAQLTDQTALTLIEPPCGSNTAVLQCGEALLFFDSGYACYRTEMLALLRQRIPDYDARKKTLFLTHADVDHGGLLPVFGEILLSAKSAECIRLESTGADGFREQNPLHRPYIRICKTLTGYQLPSLARLHARWGDLTPLQEPLKDVGTFAFGDLRFRVYEGAGGHLPGELLLLDFDHRIAFTGDVYVNIHGMTEAQSTYNRYAPILMTSVDTDPQLCAAERQAFFALLTPGTWRIFGAHGACKTMTV